MHQKTQLHQLKCNYSSLCLA